MAGLETLAQRWRNDAGLLRQYRNIQQAEWLEDRATELERALQEQSNELLTLIAAGEASGYSADHLAGLFREGVRALGVGTRDLRQSTRGRPQ